eukprot:527532-Prymnesium_polylepis.1
MRTAVAASDWTNSRSPFAGCRLEAVPHKFGTHRCPSTGRAPGTAERSRGADYSPFQEGCSLFVAT